ncbi:PREDICTED: F-box protein SKP2A [Tarenaya hassleriana]|uniref:F-box protein SKP2A n=1 Tax=Tarenaya hassleriana TaxID=28532 RepID=UPI00053C2831|nr:PREDICTED: F-box protein SKP2A [Tarenaya hassleriana]XP_010537318.1 PREDICTED: F-box protein SKP2A [Tarenaya hassleriana]XP_010537319.1 PREDICTED: F-box protein SKP2A [Tarenaya hassleriana]XP_010537320.1 PREDICTED: F-box protein SKP2A [Tarenaya hassleriana]
MMGREAARTTKGSPVELNRSFQKMAMAGSGVMKMEGLAITEWKDIPVELLMRILSLVDDRTVIMASGVCSGWRDAICFGLTHLCLSWCKNNMNNLVLSLAPKFTKLQTLILRQDKPQLEDNSVKAIANYCHELQDLDLSKSFKLSDRSLYALADGCPNLMKLNISGCTSFNEDGLAYLTSFCRKLKVLNLCGCVKAASDNALQAIGRNCNQLQSLNLGWCDNISDSGVMSLAYGCPDLRTLDLCGCVLITDESVVALANRCVHLRSLGLYYCRNITDRAMYSLAQSGVKNKPEMWKLSSVKRRKGKPDEEGLRSLNISQCTALTPSAVQAVCDTFPALHTCSGRHSLVMSGCLNLTSVHCACIFRSHHAFPHTAH